MKEIKYRTHGICAVEIDVRINDDGTVEDVKFFGGCDGNHKGLVSLCKGMQASEVVKRLKGVDCMGRGTSCPDQLAEALQQAL